MTRFGRKRVTVRGGGPLEELYRLHAPAAWRVAWVVLRNPDDAADAVAEAFARLCAAGVPAEADARAYVLAAVRNAAIDAVRRSRRERLWAGGGAGPEPPPARAMAGTAGALDPPDPPDPAAAAVAGENRALLAQAFASLPERWRSALWLIDVEELSTREAGSILGVTPNTAAQLASRGRSRVRQRFLQAHVANHVRPGCDLAVAALGAHVAGTLPPGRKARVDAHLDACRDCSARRADLDDVRVALRGALPPLPLALLDWRPPRPRGSVMAVLEQIQGAPSAVAAQVVSSGGPAWTAAGERLVAAATATVLVAGMSAAALRGPSPAGPPPGGIPPAAAAAAGPAPAGPAPAAAVPAAAMPAGAAAALPGGAGRPADPSVGTVIPSGLGLPEGPAPAVPAQSRAAADAGDPAGAGHAGAVAGRVAGAVPAVVGPAASAASALLGAGGPAGPAPPVLGPALPTLADTGAAARPSVPALVGATVPLVALPPGTGSGEAPVTGALTGAGGATRELAGLAQDVVARPGSAGAATVLPAPVLPGLTLAAVVPGGAGLPATEPAFQAIGVGNRRLLPETPVPATQILGPATAAASPLPTALPATPPATLPATPPATLASALPAAPATPPATLPATAPAATLPTPPATLPTAPAATLPATPPPTLPAPPPTTLPTAAATLPTAAATPPATLTPTPTPTLVPSVAAAVLPALPAATGALPGSPVAAVPLGQ